METAPPQEGISKQERFELQRQEKERARAAEERKRLVKKMRFSVVVALVVSFLGYGIFYIATLPARPMPGAAVPILGRDHIQVGATHSEYNSNPPTSGSHYADPAAWGVYQNELPDEQLIHNLEHGGIWISYKPDIDPSTKSQLESIGKKYPGSVVVTPRVKNDSVIALASWGRLEKLESFDEAKIVDFVGANRNKSPEPLAR